MTRSRPHDGHPHFLLVEDHDLAAVAYRRALGRYGIVTLASGVAEAGLVIAAIHLTGLVVDVSLPDGSGLEVAREARARAPDLPILIVSADVDAERLDVADELGAAYLLKPLEAVQLSRFAERALARQQRASDLLAEWQRRYGLSAAETVTLRLAVEGLRRDEIAARRGVGVNTVRTQIGTLLVKVGIATIAETIAAFYRELSGTR